VKEYPPIKGLVLCKNDQDWLEITDERNAKGHTLHSQHAAAIIFVDWLALIILISSFVFKVTPGLHFLKVTHFPLFVKRYVFTDPEIHSRR